ncbi:MAG: UDP-N-acetylglucosamine 2-epimerase (non-hydrolyzing) [Archaeoglobaceae archaeon]
MKIATVVGARPQFIKMFVVSRELDRAGFEEIIIHTGQHYDYEMDRIFFEQLKIPEPDYNLGVGSGTHGFQTGEMIKRIEEVLFKEKPDIVLVYGDTNSTLAGALVGAKLGIKIAHVEAGLRCYDKSVPEEINRVLTDHISSYLFAPTKRAVENLKKEGLVEGVYLTGDVMLDAVLQTLHIAEQNSEILEKLELDKGDYLLATVHRAENTDIKENLTEIVKALIECGEKIVFPMHPRTRKMLIQFSILSELEKADNIIITKPLGYLDMLMLEKNARKILTDSGGVQKEAYFFRVPCITLRNKTEWSETVEDGWNILVGANKERIIWAIESFEPKGDSYTSKFGNGKASERIVEILGDCAYGCP